MQRFISPRRHFARRLTGVATAAIVTAGLVSLAPTAQGQDEPVPSDSQDSNVHFNNGKSLGKVGATRGESVRNFFTAHGHNAATASSLQADGPSWKSRGVTHLRMDQHVAGLRVYDTYARAAFKNGKLVDLIENIADVPSGAPAAADVDSAAALRAAVTSLYPGRSADTRSTGKSGNTTRYAKDGFYSEPSVEKVAVPTESGGLAVGYVVETWTAGDNLLYETLVSGDGAVVDSELRTAEDSYNVFEEDPDASGQRVVRNPSDPAASPSGWLFAGTQLSRNITGNNAHAYVDANADDAPDVGGAPVSDGAFTTKFSDKTKPTTDANRNVSVQNLFYLNNLIHDTLYKAGFTESVGNFQENNFTNGGAGGDPVLAETQDGSGTDNANFATPGDGKDPRMQMYLWSVPGMFEVNVPTGPAAGSYGATNATWGPPITATGVSGPLAVAIDDGSPDPIGTPSPATGDACSTIVNDLTGKVAIVDRGICGFVEKAKFVQDAGAIAVIVVNNRPGAPTPMGGGDRKVVISGLMVADTAGPILKPASGSTAILRLNPNAIMKDSSLDSDIVWHEYGHGLTWRMIGKMGGPLSAAIGEGMSDVLSVIVNDDPVVGEYSAVDPAGIRTHSYELYNRTYGDIVGAEVHFDGEVYGAIGWDLWKAYKSLGLGEDAILADLVDGMNYTPANPTFEQMRDGILTSLTLSGSDRSCMVWKSFARYGVGEGASGVVNGSRVTVTESTTVPAGCTP